MGLYFVYAPSIYNRKSEHLFSFYKGQCLLNGKAIFDTAKGLDSYKQINDYSLENDIDSYEIVIGDKYPLQDIVSYLSKFLEDKDINIGLLTKSREYARKNEVVLNQFGVTYSKHSNIRPRDIECKCVKLEMASNFDGVSKVSCSASRILRKNNTPIKLEESFHDRFMKLLIESGKDNVEVYKASGISRQVFSKIISDKDMIPTKLTLMSLCIGLELPLLEAKQLMESAGYSLSKSILMDSIIMKYLKDEIYDFTLINSELNEYGCQLLGWHPRES